MSRDDGGVDNYWWECQSCGDIWCTVDSEPFNCPSCKGPAKRTAKIPEGEE